VSFGLYHVILVSFSLYHVILVSSGLYHVILVSFGLYHVILVSSGLYHVILVSSGLYHVILVSFGLYHVILVSSGLYHVILVSSGLYHVILVSSGLYHVILVSFGLYHVILVSLYHVIPRCGVVNKKTEYILQIQSSLHHITCTELQIRTKKQPWKWWDCFYWNPFDSLRNLMMTFLLCNSSKKNIFKLKLKFNIKKNSRCFFSFSWIKKMFSRAHLLIEREYEKLHQHQPWVCYIIS
jgi:hypothetical protein